jgi:hypothetical protein
MANYIRPDPLQPGWCDTGEAVKPQDTDIATGWPPDQIPPSRQEFNWLDKQQDAGIKYLCRVGISEYANAEEYQGLGLVIGSNGSVYWNLRACSGIDPVYDNAGYWELTPIRLSDADARYLTIINAAGLYLTEAQGDARYAFKTDLAAFITYPAGDARYALKGDLLAFFTKAESDARYLFKGDLANYVTYPNGDIRYMMRTEMGAYVTYSVGDARYALKTELTPYETIAHAAATYLKIIDAANTYLSQSAAAQMYLTVADANNRFAATTADAHAYTDTSVANASAAQKIYTDSSVNNAIAAQRNWTIAMLPGLKFRREDYSGGGGSMTAEWMILTAQPNNGAGFELAWGSGTCQEGDTITLPTNFPVGNMMLQGYVESALGYNLPNDLKEFALNFSGARVQNCYLRISGSGQRYARGYAFGRWTSFGYH